MGNIQVLLKTLVEKQAKHVVACIKVTNRWRDQSPRTHQRWREEREVTIIGCTTALWHLRHCFFLWSPLQMHFFHFLTVSQLHSMRYMSQLKSWRDEVVFCRCQLGAVHIFGGFQNPPPDHQFPISAFEFKQKHLTQHFERLSWVLDPCYVLVLYSKPSLHKLPLFTYIWFSKTRLHLPNPTPLLRRLT